MVTDSSTREVPNPHMLSQCSFREVVSWELVEDSTRKLVIVNFPTREHMTVVQLLVELVNKLVQVFWDMPEPQQAIVGGPVQRAEGHA